MYKKVIKVARKATLDGEIEKHKELLYRSKETIEVTDYGVGSTRARKRVVSDMAHQAISPGWKAALIRNIATYFECSEIVELGTSFGITTLYLSRVPESIVTTFEGCPNTAKIANRNFDLLEQRNIRLVVGNIDETLPDFLERSPRLDFAFLDANHTYEATMRYFSWCRKKSHDGTVFILDDIHYSGEMEKAWTEICALGEVRLSIDLFHVGIVIFDPSLVKQHFILSC